MQLTLLPVSQEYHQLDQLVQDMSFEKEYSCKFINDYTPDDPVKRFRFILCLKNGINIPCMLFCIRQGVIMETSIICGKFYQMMMISSREVNKWLNQLEVIFQYTTRELCGRSYIKNMADYVHQ